MEHAELTRKIDAYLEENWETMVEDIETLVRIPSFEESDKATEGAPFGPGPKEALEAALEMASDMGFKTHDAEGYIGFADFPGKRPFSPRELVTRVKAVLNRTMPKPAAASDTMSLSFVLAVL